MLGLNIEDSSGGSENNALHEKLRSQNENLQAIVALGQDTNTVAVDINDNMDENQRKIERGRSHVNE